MVSFCSTKDSSVGVNDEVKNSTSRHPALPLLIWPHNQNLNLLGWVFLKPLGALALLQLQRPEKGTELLIGWRSHRSCRRPGTPDPKSVWCTGLNTSSLRLFHPTPRTASSCTERGGHLGPLYLGWSAGEAPLPGGAGWWPSGPAGLASTAYSSRSGWPAERPASPARLSAVGPGDPGCAPSPGWCSAAWTWTSRSHRAKLPRE